MREASPETVSRFRSEATNNNPPHTTRSEIYHVPFAKVNTIVPGSPAEEAGLKVGDRIRVFGVVNWRNHEKLSKIAELVGKSEGVNIAHSLQRRSVNSGFGRSKTSPYRSHENDRAICSWRSFKFS